MAASSSSSACACNSEKYSPNDGPSEVTRAGVQRSTVNEESSSFMEQFNNSQDDKCKGKGKANSQDDKCKGKTIISGAGDFDELNGGKVVTPDILEAESSHMVGMDNLQIRKGIHPSLTDKQGEEMDLGIRVFGVTLGSRSRVSDTQGEEIDGVMETEEIEGEEIDGETKTTILCGCCYWEFQLEDTVQCPNGHLFCFNCVRKQVEKILYGGFKAHPSLGCMDISGCKESIPLSEIRRALPNDIIERYEDHQAQDCVAEARIEGLIYCPFCNIPYEVDKCIQVLECQNTKCLQASCIQCKKLNHLPLFCEEVQKMPDTLRGEVEERMTKAVIRECNICHAKLIKMDGTCNKVRCRCGNAMCYVCGETISFNYNHYCACFDRRSKQGKRCQICNRCNLMGKVAEDNEALDAKEEALKELADKEPKLLDLEIGPPLKRLRQQPPTMEERRPLQYQPVSPLREFNELDRASQIRFMVDRPRDVNVSLVYQRQRPRKVERPPVTPTPLFKDDEHDANMHGPKTPT